MKNRIILLGVILCSGCQAMNFNNTPPVAQPVQMVQGKKATAVTMGNFVVEVPSIDNVKWTRNESGSGRAEQRLEIQDPDLLIRSYELKGTKLTLQRVAAEYFDGKKSTPIKIDGKNALMAVTNNEILMVVVWGDRSMLIYSREPNKQNAVQKIVQSIQLK
jgi:hypothetical protein